MAAAQRRLSLHESALSPTEYTHYQALFEEIVESRERTIGVREARGWLKGRYSSVVDAAGIDKVCSLLWFGLVWYGELSERADAEMCGLL